MRAWFVVSQNKAYIFDYCLAKLQNNVVLHIEDKVSILMDRPQES